MILRTGNPFGRQSGQLRTQCIRYVERHTYTFGDRLTHLICPAGMGLLVKKSLQVRRAGIRPGFVSTGCSRKEPLVPKLLNQRIQQPGLRVSCVRSSEAIHAPGPAGGLVYDSVECPEPSIGPAPTYLETVVIRGIEFGYHFPGQTRFCFGNSMGRVWSSDQPAASRPVGDCDEQTAFVLAYLKPEVTLTYHFGWSPNAKQTEWADEGVC